jgi:alpha-tubulin suppressor-like RCC1 family protein
MTDPDEDGNYDVSSALYMDPKTRKIDHDKVQRLFLTPQFVHWDVLCQPTLPRRVIAVGLGHYHILVAARDGGALESQVYASGLNNDGQLGLGHKKTCHALTHVCTFQPSVFQSTIHCQREQVSHSRSCAIFE